MPGRELKIDSDSRNDQKTKFVVWFVRTPWQTLSNQRINVFWLVFPTTCVQDLDLKSQKTRNLTHKKWLSASLWDRMGYNHQQQNGIYFSYGGFFKSEIWSILEFSHDQIDSKHRLKKAGFGKIVIFPKVLEKIRSYHLKRLKKGHSNLEFER